MKTLLLVALLVIPTFGAAAAFPARTGDAGH